MIIDALLLLSDAQAFTATAVSTNAIDLGNPTVKNRIGSGEPMEITVEVDVAADFTTANETYQFDVISDDAAALSSPTVLASYIRTAAELTIGSVHHFPVPKSYPRERYMGLQLTMGGTTPTITITAHLQPQNMVQDLTTYAKGYSA